MLPTPIAPERSPELSADYETIAAVIEFIQSQRHQQPNLAAIAAHMHLSEGHLQKLFSRWAGVSPKRFLQLLTVEDAKRRLAASRSLLDVSLATGLSSPSRLHDWFVRLEAMTPGEFRAGGKSLAIAYGLHDTRFGCALIATTDRGICHLQFCEPEGQAAAVARLQQQWPQATLHPDPSGTQPISDRLNAALTPPAAPPLSVLVQGTNFQVQVWRALLRLPGGSVTTYQAIAESIGKPQATRAVGTAIGANPVAYFIPCHRVIRRTGALGGYRWGLARKSALLAWEASQQKDSQP
ncbi:MAG TPA: methylated-DNA--[protein]-cysteine S-methyltransferase [Candidatus Obscuribacterales bacterium]